MKLNDSLLREIVFKSNCKKQKQKISKNKENHKLLEQLQVGFNNSWKVKRKIMSLFMPRKLNWKGLLQNKKQKSLIQRKSVKINMIN